MRQATFAPRHLPIAPRPITGELVSSWLLRVAARNGITLEELLTGLWFAHPNIRKEVFSLDYDLPTDLRLALADFCRVSPESIRQLELKEQFPKVPSHLFLAYGRNVWTSGRQAMLRARYDFCLECLGEFSHTGSLAFIPAIWSLAPLTLCHKHHLPLLSTCPACSAADPFLFPVLSEDLCFRCRNCLANLSTRPVP